MWAVVIIASMVILALIFWFLGWRWERTVKRPEGVSKNTPLVSIIIPAFKSEKEIEGTIKSAKNIDYPRKEIIVVNDSKDKTPEICKKHGVRIIQNKKRMGKARALNKALKYAKGKFLFFLDADTTARLDCLTKLMPWFSYPKTAVVVPRYTVRNKHKNMLTRLASVESAFISSMFKTHMFFGSLIGFRGCGVAVRRSALEEVGGWPNTLIEDHDLAMRINAAGYNIQYEPKAIVKTNEPTSISELKRQRFRWGKGGTLTFLNHREKYPTHAQFTLSVLPYFLLTLAIISFVIWQTTIYFLPLVSFYLIYTFSIKEFLTLSAIFLVPFFSSILASVTTATLSHVAIITYPEEPKSDKKDILLVIPYIFFYLPLTILLYAKGAISGIRDTMAKRKQLRFKDW